MTVEFPKQKKAIKHGVNATSRNNRQSEFVCCIRCLSYLAVNVGIFSDLWLFENYLLFFRITWSVLDV